MYIVFPWMISSHNFVQRCFCLAWIWNQLWKQILWLKFLHLLSVMDYQVFCITVFTLDKIQLLAAQPRLDCTGSAGQGRGKTLGKKKRGGGKGNELFGSSCFDCCFCSPALYSAASPVFITFNIMVIFIIYFLLMSSSPNLKPTKICFERECVWLRILFHFSLPQKNFLSWKVSPNSWPKKMKYYQYYVLVIISRCPINCQHWMNIPLACEYCFHIWDSHRDFCCFAVASSYFYLTSYLL